MQAAAAVTLSPPRPPPAAKAPLAAAASPKARRRLCPRAAAERPAAATTAAATTTVTVLDLGWGTTTSTVKDQHASPLRVPDWLDTPPVVATEEAAAAAPAPPDPPQQQPPLAHGSVELLTGPMFSGKSTALLDRVADLALRGRDVAVVKPERDSRYARHMVVSHAGRAARCYRVSRLAELRPLLGEARWARLDAVAIDEAQFFPDLVEFVLEASEGGGGGGAAGAGGEDDGEGAPAAPASGGGVRPKAVVVAGLSGDFKRRPFGRVAELLPIADRVRALRAECFSCGADAPFSLRLVAPGAGAGAPAGGAGAAEQQQQQQRDQQVLVGGAEAYRPACRACFVRHTAAAAAAAKGG